MSSATVVSTKHTGRILTQPSQEDSVASRIKDYIERKHTEKPLCLRVPESIAESTKVINSLASRRAEYDGTYLTITPMPSALHEVVSRWFWRICTYEICPLLDEKEQNWIETGTIHKTLPGQCHGSDEEESLKKKEARRKSPDGAIVFVHPDSKESTPRVILETGFMESIDDLHSDMRQWLTKDDNVQLVILVKIDQDRKALTSHQQSEKFNDRLHDLINKFGNEKARNSLGIDVNHPSPSGKDAYEGIKNTIEIDDWLGPVTAFLEAWQRWGKNGYRRRGKKVVSPLFPSSSINANSSSCQQLIPNFVAPTAIPVKITDLIPADCRDRSPNFNSKRAAFLKLEHLRDRILQERGEHARELAIERVRPD